MDEIAIDVRNVTIAYKGNNAVNYRVFLKNLFRPKGKKISTGSAFEAVKNVSFNVKKNYLRWSD